MKYRHLPQTTTRTKRVKRRGAIAPLTAIMMVPIMALVAFTVDYGYVLKARASLQRAADAAALAAVRDLLPADDGTQNLATVRATIRQYAAANITEVANFTILDADIEIGRYDPETVYTSFTILNTGTFDTVRVRLRRDTQANSPIPLFFARVLGINTSNISATATAVLQKASLIPPGADVLPFSIPAAEWEAASPGTIWKIYGDNKMTDNDGDVIPGNWGTLDIGGPTNSTSDMSDQMLNGLRQKDLDDLYATQRISQNTHIDSTEPWYSNGDPGLSSGMKHAVQAIHGETRLIPIYDSISAMPPPAGNRVELHVTGWAVARVVDSNWAGSKNSYVEIKKAFMYDGLLKPQPDLSITDGVIEGAFTSPALVQ